MEILQTHRLTSHRVTVDVDDVPDFSVGADGMNDPEIMVPNTTTLVWSYTIGFEGGWRLAHVSLTGHRRLKAGLSKLPFSVFLEITEGKLPANSPAWLFSLVGTYQPEGQVLIP